LLTLAFALPISFLVKAEGFPPPLRKQFVPAPKYGIALSCQAEIHLCFFCLEYFNRLFYSIASRAGHAPPINITQLTARRFNMKMKLAPLLSSVFILLSSQLSFAAEQTVRLHVPGCMS